MFEKKRGPAWLQHAADFGEHRSLVGDRAEGEGRDDSVESIALKRHRLADAAPDIGLDAARLGGRPAHREQFGRGIKAAETRNPRGLIKFHVDAAAAAKLEHVARRLRHDLAAQFHDLPLRAGAFDEARDPVTLPPAAHRFSPAVLFASRPATIAPPAPASARM